MIYTEICTLRTFK